MQTFYLAKMVSDAGNYVKERGKPKLAPESNVYAFVVTSITG